LCPSLVEPDASLKRLVHALTLNVIAWANCRPLDNHALDIKPLRRGKNEPLLQPLPISATNQDAGKARRWLWELTDREYKRPAPAAPAFA